jgi:hypothetical protein
MSSSQKTQIIRFPDNIICYLPKENIKESKMNTVEKIIEQLKSMPESDQAEVLDFLEYLKSKEGREKEDSEWSQFSLDSAMRGIEEEPSPYGIEDIKEKFS